MKLAGTYEFAAPQKIVWDALQDPEILARVLPGCRKLEQTGENSYKGKLKIKVGPVNGMFDGTVHLLDLAEPSQFTMQVKGRGPAGFVDGKGVVTLSASNGTTHMQYDGAAKVGGRIASVGQRLMDSSAKAITKQALQGLDQQIQAKLIVETPAAVAERAVSTPEPTPFTPTNTSTGKLPPPPEFSTEPPPPPSQWGFASSVAKDVINDLVQFEETHQRLAAAGIFTGILLILWHGMQRRLSKKTADRVIKVLREQGIIQEST